MKKEYNAETIRLRANEIMLNAKGFVLYTVNTDGSLSCIGDCSEMSAVEQCGLNAFRHEMYIGGEDEEE